MSTKSFLAELHMRGPIISWLAAPRWLRWAWALNIDVSPPLFWSARAIFLCYTNYASWIVWTLTMASGLLGTHMTQGWSLEMHLAVSFYFGIIVGALASWYYPKKAKDLKLQNWPDFVTATKLRQRT